MRPEDVQKILNTRLKAAERTGNHTEASLLIELLKMAEEYARMKDGGDNAAD